MDDEKKFKIRRFGFRIIKEGDKPPRIEYIDDFDNNTEVFEKEFENMFRKIHQMQMEMLRMFGIEPVKIVERVKEESDFDREEQANLPMFDVSREGDKLKIAVLLENNSKNVDVKIEDGKLVITGDGMNIRVPLNSDFKNGKIISKDIRNGVLNIVIER